MVLARFMGRPRANAQWLGILVAAILAGLWHLGSPADVLRVVSVNGVVGAVYGWVYWWRGLELAIDPHGRYWFLYIAVPVFV